MAKHHRTGVIIPIIFVDPSEDSALAQGVLCDTRQELNDEMISSGYTLGIHPLLVETPLSSYSPEGLKTAVLKLTADLSTHHDERSTEDMTFETAVAKYSAKQVKATAKIIAREVNVFTDTKYHETNRIAGQLDTILAAITPDKDNTTVVTARTRFEDEDEIQRYLTTHLYLNVVTGQAVAFFMVEGTM